MAGEVLFSEESQQILLQHFDRLISLTPRGSEGYQAVVSSYSLLKLGQYEHLRQTHDLHEAIEWAQEAIAVTPHEDSLRPWRLNNLARMLRYQYEKSETQEGLQDAIDMTREAIATTPVNDAEDRASWLCNLGCHLGYLYEQTRDVQVLEQAIQASREALTIAGEHHIEYRSMLNNLSNCLQIRYEESGKMEDLEELTFVLRNLAHMPADSSAFRAAAQQRLLRFLEALFERTRKLDDINEAIQIARNMLVDTRRDDPTWAEKLLSLAQTLDTRFTETGTIDDLEEKIQLMREAVNLTPNDPLVAQSFQAILGSSLGQHYNALGKTEDLEEAFEVFHKMVNAMQDDDALHTAVYDGYSIVLAQSYKRRGKLADLEEAIQYSRKAVTLVPHGDDLRSCVLINLSRRIATRFMHLGRMEDIAEAIRLASEAVKATLPENPSRRVRLTILGTSLARRYERTGIMKDLEEALQLAREVVDTGAQCPMRGLWLRNLSNRLYSWYQETGSPEALSESIEVGRRDLTHTPITSPERAASLGNLAGKLLAQYDRTSTVQYLEEGTHLTQQAISALTEDDPRHADWAINLGICYRKRYQRFSELGDILRAKDYFTLAWKNREAVPLRRLAAANAALEIFVRQSKWSEASTLAIEAVRLLPSLTTHTLSRQDQQLVVSKFSGLAALACSLLLLQAKSENVGSRSEGLMEEAIQILELGRGAIMGLLVDKRSDTTALGIEHPREAAALEELLTRMNRTIDDDDSMNFTEQRTNISEQLQQLIERIRSIPGYAEFFSSPRLERIKQMAAEGPILLVNVSDIRSDAICVLESTIRVLPLPQLHASDIQSWSDKGLVNFDHANEGQRNKLYVSFLVWLWENCVKMVLEMIGIDGPPKSDTIPRVWWIGTGVATSLPFHAAGDHAQSSTENTLSRVISSYTPTLKALRYARQREREIDVVDKVPRLLTVAMPATPGLPDLDAAMEEIEQIRRVVGGSFAVGRLPSPSSQQVLESLPSYDVAHFACHGESNAADPSESCLIFQRCTPDPGAIADPLTVSQVSQMQLKSARLAFLSACSTAESKVQPLKDEVIHITSGFQMAGYPHVIGSLWSSSDKVCVELAKEFYLRLTKLRWNELQGRDIALALHGAVLGVRSRGRMRRTPLLWAQYVHFGA